VGLKGVNKLAIKKAQTGSEEKQPKVEAFLVVAEGRITRSTETIGGGPNIPVSKWVKMAGNAINMPRGDGNLHHLSSDSHKVTEVTHYR
jgi:hypothetical protein